MYVIYEYYVCVIHCLMYNDKNCELFDFESLVSSTVPRICGWYSVSI